MRTVVLTRPEGHNEDLAHCIRAAGHQAIIIPWLQIEFKWSEEGRAAWWSNEAGLFKTIMFVSAAAVQAAIPEGMKWPAEVWAVATGPGTARALHAKGVPAQWVRAPKNRLDSEGVWTECAECFLPGTHVMIFRGQSGRGWLGDRARQANCVVEYQTVYHRLPCMHAADEVRNLAQKHSLDALVVTNSEAIRSVGSQLPAQIWAHTKVFVPHGKIEEAAKKAGAQDVVLTEGGDEGLCRALQHWLQSV